MRSSPDNSGPTSAQLEARFRVSGAIDRIRKATETRLHTTAAARTARTRMETQRMIAANPDADPRTLMSLLNSSVMPDIENSIKTEVACITAPESAEWLRDIFRSEYNRAVQMERDHLFSRAAQAAALTDPAVDVARQPSPTDIGTHHSATHSTPFLNPSVARNNSPLTGKSDTSADPALLITKKPVKHSVQTFLKAIKRTSAKAARSQVNRSTSGSVPPSQFSEGGISVEKKPDKVTQRTTVKHQRNSRSKHCGKKSLISSKRASPENLPSESRTSTYTNPPFIPNVESQNPLVQLANAAGMDSPHMETSVMGSVPLSVTTPQSPSVPTRSKPNRNISSTQGDSNSLSVAASIKVGLSEPPVHDQFARIDTAVSQSPQLEKLPEPDDCLSRVEPPTNVVLFKSKEYESQGTLDASDKLTKTYSINQMSLVADVSDDKRVEYHAQVNVKPAQPCSFEKKLVSPEVNMSVDNSSARMQLAKELISFKENCQKKALKPLSVPVVAHTQAAEQKCETVLNSKTNVLPHQYPALANRSSHLSTPKQPPIDRPEQEEKRSETRSQALTEKHQSASDQDHDSNSNSLTVNLERNTPIHVLDSNKSAAEKACNRTTTLASMSGLMKNSRKCSDQSTLKTRKESSYEGVENNSPAFCKTVTEVAQAPSVSASVENISNTILALGNLDKAPLQPIAEKPIAQCETFPDAQCGATPENVEPSGGTIGSHVVLTAGCDENQKEGLSTPLPSERKELPQVNALNKRKDSFDQAGDLARVDHKNEASSPGVLSSSVVEVVSRHDGDVLVDHNAVNDSVLKRVEHQAGSGEEDRTLSSIASNLSAVPQDTSVGQSGPLAMMGPNPMTTWKDKRDRSVFETTVVLCQNHIDDVEKPKYPDTDGQDNRLYLRTSSLTDEKNKINLEQERPLENTTDGLNDLSKTLKQESDQIMADGVISVEKECILSSSKGSHVSIQDAVGNSQTVQNLQTNTTNNQEDHSTSDDKNMPPKFSKFGSNKRQGFPDNNVGRSRVSVPRSGFDSRRTDHAKVPPSTPSASSLETRRSPGLNYDFQADSNKVSSRKRKIRKESQNPSGLHSLKANKADPVVEETGREKLVATMLAQMAGSVSAGPNTSAHFPEYCGSSSEEDRSSRESFEDTGDKEEIKPRKELPHDQSKREKNTERTGYVSPPSSSSGKEDVACVKSIPRSLKSSLNRERSSTELKIRSKRDTESPLASSAPNIRQTHEDGRARHSRERNRQGTKRSRNRSESPSRSSSSSHSSPLSKKRRSSGSIISNELSAELLEVSGSHIENTRQNYVEAADSLQLHQAYDFNKQVELLRMLQRLMKTPDAAPFVEPVERTGEFGMRYHSIIKNPMDLGTISQRLASSTAERAYYRNTAAVLEDVELVWSNCRTFNPMYDEVTLAANRCADELNKMLSDAGLVSPSRTNKVRRRASRSASRPPLDMPRSVISKSPRKKPLKSKKTSGKRLNRDISEGRMASEVLSPTTYPDNDGRLVGKQIAIFAAISGRVKAWYRVKVLSHNSASSSYMLKWLDDDDNITTGATFGLNMMYPVYRS